MTQAGRTYGQGQQFTKEEIEQMMSAMTGAPSDKENYREKDKNYNEEEGDGKLYSCKSCGSEKRVDDYQRNAESWCDSDECGTVRYFERVHDL